MIGTTYVAHECELVSDQAFMSCGRLSWLVRVQVQVASLRHVVFNHVVPLCNQCTVRACDIMKHKRAIFGIVLCLQSGTRGFVTTAFNVYTYELVWWGLQQLPTALRFYGRTIESSSSSRDIDFWFNRSLKVRQFVFISTALWVFQEFNMVAWFASIHTHSVTHCFTTKSKHKTCHISRYYTIIRL